MEGKVAEWIRDFPVVWNVGMGPAGGSFVRTLSRLLFERTNGICGPYDHVACVHLPPEAASNTAHRLLAFEVLVEMARTLVGDNDEVVEELKRLAAEERYFGYGTISDNLMIRAFGSKEVERIHKAMQGNSHLLLLDNLHVPVSLDVFLLITNGRRPSLFQNRRCLISATSKDVYHKSRRDHVPFDQQWELGGEHYHAPNLDDLRGDWDWAVLLREALRDAAGSIHRAVKQHQRQGGRTQRGLLVSPTYIPTAAAAATIAKNKNYRAAYESGMVIIRALQEYSLFPPIYSVASPTVASTTSSSASTSSKDDDGAVVLTGLSKLAEGVHRLQQDQLFDEEKIHILRWVSFMNDDGRHVSWDWKIDWRGRQAHLIPREMNMTSLILKGCSDISRIPFSKLLNTLLRVLDLSYTPINCLPPGFSRLLSLRLLSLRGCTKLETLSAPPASPTTSEQQPNKPPLAHLENLQVLDMNDVPLLEITLQDGSNKSNLHFLDLSGSRLTTLPSNFFCEMSCLEELILGNCSHLKELPPSLAKLHNLLILHVEGTQITSFPEDTFQAMQRLHTLKLMNNILLMSLPVSLSQAKGLRELHVSNCISLSLDPLLELLSFLEDLYIQTREALVDIRIHGHPNLKTFSLSGPWVRFLSLRGCGKLKFVNFHDDLTALEVVDLSDTALEEVPHSLPNLPRLWKLLLMNVPCFKRFPWHQLVRFPKVFYLDHSADDYDQVSKTSHLQETCAYENWHEVNETTNAARIKISDPKMFYSFNTDAADRLVMNKQFLQSFNVQVKPCHVKSLEPKKKKGQKCTIAEKQFPYHDVHSSKADSIAPMMKLQPKQRHVEISANNQWSYSLRHLLSVTYMVCLEECQLIHCNEMKVVFTMSSSRTGLLPSLKILQISNLNNLLRLVEPSDVEYSNLITLKLLKHIHLEHCPRLEEIFPCSLSIPALETLVIVFCSNLKTIFYKQGYYNLAPSPLPSIKSIYLQELPQLQHFHDDATFRFETPNWEKLFLRGCPSFQRLPLLKQEYPKSKVQVSGERGWWGKLQWSLPEQREHFLYLPPPQFTSCKKHIIKSYLR
ncbi:hypothetical protein BS78_05G079400 [Paspalum vaginatum]|nr:hypothetical protein BS78_05G079400 [Paspalum vaginatum]